MKKTLLSVINLIYLLCTLEINPVHAQGQLTPAWTVFHNGALPGFDHSNAILCDTAGNVFITGQSFQNSTTGSITTVKYDMNGSMLWTDNYKGVIVTAENEGTDICSDPFGNILVTGTVAWNDGDFSILKFNQSGRLWVKNKEPYQFGSGIDYAKEIATDAAGNIYCVASVQSLAGQMQDLYTLKCDSSGNDIWSENYSSASGDDWAEGLAVTPDGHCYSITSSYNFFGSSTYDMQTIHYDSGGAQVWISSYNYLSSQSEDYPLDIKCDAAYNTWICGVADAGSHADMAAMKQNSYGSQLWVVTYNGTAGENDTAIAISYLPNDLAVVTGRTREVINGGVYDAITTLLIDSGVVLWTSRYYGDTLNAIPTSMTTDSQGNIYISGYYQTSAQGLNGVVLVYNQAGVLYASHQFDGSAHLNDRFNDLTIDNQGVVYVTGQSYSAFNNSNYVTIKYSVQGMSGISESSRIENLFVYPNPAGREFNIDVSNLRGSTLQIVAMDGKTVYTEDIKSEPFGHHIITSVFNPGLYFIRVFNDSHCLTKKLIIR